MNKSEIFFNQSFDKKRLKALIEWVFKTFGEKEALRVVEDLKKTGFRNATRAGISLGLHELTTPPDKAFLVSNAQITMNQTHSDFIGARITATERSQRIVDTWHRVSETLRKQVVDYFSTYDKLNPIYIMALSGARGNFSQVRQLVGMRGLMADPQGKIISFPIRSNLREGLTLTEYFISCSGARKGLVDTALRTADTGYLTRRLVDVSHHIVIKRVACNTHKGILIKKLQSNNKTLLSLKDRLIGRVLAEHITLLEENKTLTLSPLKQNNKKFKLNDLQRNRQIDSFNTNQNSTNQSIIDNNLTINDISLQSFQKNVTPSLKKRKNVLAQKDQEIFPDLAFRISNIKQEVLIRSPLTCAFNHELCQLCYGWSLSQGNLVPLGEAVGVIAAQSIGEPGTQLTMRTFHTGGVFSGDLLQEIRASHSGKIYYSQAVQGLLIRTTHGKIAFLTKTAGDIIVVPDSNTSTGQQNLTNSLQIQKTHFSFQKLSMLFVRQGEYVEKNQLLAEVSDFGDEGNQSIKSQQTIFAEISGRVIEIQGGGLNINELEREEEENNENDENESFYQIEPEKSGKLGLFKILSIGIGATFNPQLTTEKITSSESVTGNVILKQPLTYKSTSLYPRKNICVGINRISTKKSAHLNNLSNNNEKQNLLLSKQNVFKQYLLSTSVRLNNKQIPKQYFYNVQNDNRILPPFSIPLKNLNFRSLNHIPAAAGVLPIFAVFKPKHTTSFLLLQKQKSASLMRYKLHKHIYGNSKIVGVHFRQALTLGIQKNNKTKKNKPGFPKTSLSNLAKNTPNLLFSPFVPNFNELNWRNQKVSQIKQNSHVLNSRSLFYLRTIAEEGDLVNENYKNIYPQ